MLYNKIFGFNSKYGVFSPVPQQREQISLALESYILIISHTLCVENNIAAQYTEIIMECITHTNVSQLTAAAHSVKNALNIKLTRAKERHASALGYNSFNHAAAEVKVDEICIHFEEYIKNLQSDVLKHHQIDIDANIVNELRENLCDEPFKKTDIFLYAITVSEDINQHEMPREAEGFNETIIIKEDDFSCDGDLEAINKLINGKAILFRDQSYCGHHRFLTGLNIIATTKQIQECFPIAEYFEAIEIDKIKLILPNEIIEDDEFFDEINDLAKAISSKRNDYWKYLHKNKRIVIGEISHDTHSFDISPESSQSLMAERLSTREPLDELGPSFVRHPYFNFQTNASAHMPMLSEVFSHKFDSEYLESFADTASEMKSITRKLSDESNFIMESEWGDPDGGAIGNLVYVDSIRHTSRKLHRQQKDLVTFKEFIDLLKEHKVKYIQSNVCVAHNTGAHIVHGCTSFDKDSKPSLQFQLFTPGYEFYDETLPKIEKLTDIKFTVQHELEYNLQAQHYDDGEMYGLTFSYPEFNIDPVQVAFIAYKAPAQKGPFNQVDLKENPDTLPWLSRGDFRDSTILPPMMCHIRTEDWLKEVNKEIEKLQSNKEFTIKNLHRALSLKMRSNAPEFIWVSPIIFNTTEDTLADIAIQSMHLDKFSPSQKAIGELSKQTNLIGIEDYYFIIRPPEY